MPPLVYTIVYTLRTVKTMKQYALVVKQDELSKKVAKEIRTGLMGVLEYNQNDPDLVT